MKVMDYHEAIFASKLSSHAKLTALAISSYYNWTKKQMCWPSNKTLSEATSMSISSVVRSKKELVKAGFLEVQRRIDNSNLYRPLLPQTIGYVHKDQDPWSIRPTNNEYNNEVNNEIKDRDSDESLQLKDIKSFDILFNEIEGEINGKERTEGRRPAGRSNPVATSVYPNPRRYYYGMPEESGIIAGTNNKTNDWMD